MIIFRVELSEVCKKKKDQKVKIDKIVTSLSFLFFYLVMF